MSMVDAAKNTPHRKEEGCCKQTEFVYSSLYSYHYSTSSLKSSLTASSGSPIRLNTIS